jgi:hypothetical protein
MRIENKYAEAIRENRPILYEGLEFYPLTVRDYALYHSARIAFEIMQSSLSPKLARLSWCACLYELDKTAREKGMVGYFFDLAMAVLAKALRLTPYTDAANAGDSVIPIQVQTKNDQLEAIFIQHEYCLNMMQMDEVRRIISAQNGYKIPDEDFNPELVEAMHYTASQKETALDLNFDDLVFSVALNAHVQPSSVWGWTIRDFQKMQEAIDRTLGYQIYTTASMSGFTSFPKGSPYPTWKFNRKNELSGDMKTIDELDAGAKGLLADTTKE